MKKTKIDIRGSISDAANETAKDAMGMVAVALLFGFLFAPYFSPFFRYQLEQKYNVDKNLHLRNRVDEEMVKVNRILWIVAIVGWILTFWAYAAYNG